MPVDRDPNLAWIMPSARHLYVRRNALAQTLDMAYHTDLPRPGDGIEALKGLYC